MDTSSRSDYQIDMKQIFISIALVLSITNPSFAQEKEELGYSEAHREGKQYFLAAQPVGLGPIGSVTNGASAGLFLDRNSLILIEVKSGNTIGFFDVFDRLSVKSTTVAASYKKFVNTSFYLNGGIDYRSVTYSREQYILFSTARDKSEFKGQALAAHFAIGNQWQWDSFTFGCDWAGFSLPLASRIDSESTNSTDAENLKTFESDKQRYLKDGSGYFVQLYFGASF